MSDLTSSFDEDDAFLELHYGYGKEPFGDYAANVFSPSALPKSDSKSKRKGFLRPGLETDDFINMLHGSDPVRVELNRLENEVKDKGRELLEAQAEIKALKLTERAKEKALEELSEERTKLDEKLKATEILLENKNLELKKINDEKKAALAAQFAAEATLRRVQAAQKDEDMPPIEAILAPIEAELKLARQEVVKLQDDNRALDRLTKSKEAALLDAERTVQIAETKASLVDDLQNRNQELLKQIEICQEENKILDKMHSKKVAEVEKLSATVAELEEAVLASGATANAARDYQRQTLELMEERKTLERELARAKITANRVAVVVANEWKDANDKVMPVKQWLEERRFMQGEMQQLREKLALAERTAKTEAQLKEKFHLRLKVLEEGLKSSANGSNRRFTVSGGEEGPQSSSNGPSRRQSIGGLEDPSRFVGNGYSSRRQTSASQLRGSISSNSILKNAKVISRSFDGGRPSDNVLNRNKPLANGYAEHHRKTSLPARTIVVSHDATIESVDGKIETPGGVEDSVSGLLYDMLQKEVIALRKASHEKDQSLKDKDDAIEMLAKKVDTLTKAREVEAKKMRREVAAKEKEAATMRVDKEQEIRIKRLGSIKGTVNSSQLLSGRSSRNT
eukprot:c28209_g1_i1 orf=279-2159(+)